MLLSEIERGTHTVQDWCKRLVNSYVYGTIEGISNKPSVIYIKAMGDWNEASEEAFRLSEMYYKFPEGSTQVTKVCFLNVIAFRPDPGVYNIERFPVLASHLPHRQWHFGTTSDSFAIRRLSGENWAFGFDSLESCFNPVYPTVGDAIDMLKAKEKRHVAISNKVSLLASGAKLDRVMLLYRFTPIATIHSGMWFPSSAGKALEKVALEYKDLLLSML